MSTYVVYLDHEHASIFTLLPGKDKKVKMDRHIVRHHTNHEQKKKSDSTHFYHEVAGKLSDASEILILGHGTAKDQFFHHLQDHKHKALAEKVVGVETVDKPSDNQILDFAHRFFKKWNVFH